MEGGPANLIFIGGFFIVAYFFFIRPQQKKAKAAKVFRESLTKGDKVVTSSGMHAKIVEILGDGTAMIDLGGKTHVKIEREALSQSFSPTDKK